MCNVTDRMPKKKVYLFIELKSNEDLKWQSSKVAMGV